MKRSHLLASSLALALGAPLQAQDAQCTKSTCRVVEVHKTAPQAAPVAAVTAPCQEAKASPVALQVREAAAVAELVELARLQDESAEILASLKALGYAADTDEDEAVATLGALGYLADTADERGYMGVRMNVGDGVMEIASVMEGSGAAAAGLRAGDRIVEIAGRSTAEVESMPSFLGELQAGESVTVVYLRDGEKRKAKVRLATLAEIEGVETVEEVAEVSDEWFEVEDVAEHAEHAEHSHERGYMGIRMNIDGEAMTVLEVMPGTGAQRAGLRAGDRILKVGSLQASQGEGFANGLARLHAGEVVGVVYEREGKKGETEIRLSTLAGTQEAQGGAVRENVLRRVEAEPKVEWFAVETEGDDGGEGEWVVADPDVTWFELEDDDDDDEGDDEGANIWVTSKDGKSRSFTVKADGDISFGGDIQVEAGEADGEVRIRINGKDIVLPDLQPHGNVLKIGKGDFTFAPKDLKVEVGEIDFEFDGTDVDEFKKKVKNRVKFAPDKGSTGKSHGIFIAKPDAGGDAQFFELEGNVEIDTPSKGFFFSDDDKSSVKKKGKVVIKTITNGEEEVREYDLGSGDEIPAEVRKLLHSHGGGGNLFFSDSEKKGQHQVHRIHMGDAGGKHEIMIHGDGGGRVLQLQGGEGHVIRLHADGGEVHKNVVKRISGGSDGSRVMRWHSDDGEGEAIIEIHGGHDGHDGEDVLFLRGGSGEAIEVHELGDHIRRRVSQQVAPDRARSDDHGGAIRDLERKIEELRKQIRALEKELSGIRR